ncbi:zinc dependent phospholipase C family protein [Methanobrevibacter arboriphilus]|uniref:Uncharacterized protein n=1 Tax=Methanobrevibacter arboriphilus TaxID=39441 RepID=A0ACA8R3Z1_METAZ|nr:zinc dependent phospholipase C family protein [Methanobrevibacter arboriphilus]BBL62199.1 hypothetical protein MarbSA_12390 [Methanobrevibacter arboriphilus]
MKYENKIKKARLVLRVLFMFCWRVGKYSDATIPPAAGKTGGHQLLNRLLYNMLGTNAKNKLAPYKETLFNSSDKTNEWHNPDEIDEEWKDNHFQLNYDLCKSKADFLSNKAVSSFNSGKYREAAYQLGKAFHYVQDIACPVHMDNLVGRDEYNHPEYDFLYQISPVAEDKNKKRISDSGLHGLYEGATNNVFCSSFDNCEDYDNVQQYYISMSDMLTGWVGGLKGFDVLKNPTVMNYIKGRWKIWMNYNYKDNKPNTAKKRISQDYAFAAAIQKRYLLRSGLEVFTE